MPVLLSCPVSGRNLVSVDRLDRLGEGAATDPGLACSLQVGWEGWGAHGSLFWVSTPPPRRGRPLIEPCSRTVRLPACQVLLPKIRTLKEIFSMLDPRHLSLPQPQCPWGLSNSPVSSIRMTPCLCNQPRKTVLLTRLFHTAFPWGSPRGWGCLFLYK